MHPVRVLSLLTSLVLLGTLLFGQAGTSTIRETITDQQGRVVGNANVKLTNLATNAVRTTKTGDAQSQSAWITATLHVRCGRESPAGVRSHVLKGVSLGRLGVF